MSEFSRIICLNAGQVIEDGTFEFLLSQGNYLSRLIDNFLSAHIQRDPDSAKDSSETFPDLTEPKPIHDPPSSRPIIQSEERTLGTVPMSSYIYVLKHAGGLPWLITLSLVIILGQGSALMTNVVLVRPYRSFEGILSTKTSCL